MLLNATKTTNKCKKYHELQMPIINIKLHHTGLMIQ